MAKIINNSNELQSIFLPKLKEVVDYVVQKIWNENRELIRVLVYESYTPVKYERTGEFKEAWDTDVKTLGNYIEGEFKYNSNDLIVNPSLGQHASIIDGEPSVSYLADIIYQGMAGHIFGEGPWTKKRDAWSALDKWLTNTQFRKIFEEGMNKAGIPWKRNIGKVNVEKTK